MSFAPPVYGGPSTSNTPRLPAIQRAASINSVAGTQPRLPESATHTRLARILPKTDADRREMEEQAASRVAIRAT